MCVSALYMERRSAYCNSDIIRIRVPYSGNLQPCGKICSVGVSIKIHFLLSSLLAYTTLSEPATGFCHLSHMRVMGVKSTCEIPRHGREVKNVIQIEHANVTPL